MPGHYLQQLFQILLLKLPTNPPLCLPASREVCLLSSHRESANLQISQEISRPNLCPAQLSFGSYLGLPFSYLFPSGCLATPLDPSQAWNISPVLDSKHPVIVCLTLATGHLFPLTLKLPEWSLPPLTFLTPQPPQFGSLSKQLP